MNFRFSQFRAVCGFSLLALPVAVLAQTPRYQSPLSVPNEPQRQVTLPTPTAITPNGTVVEDVVARVNDRIISRSDMERSEQQLAAENQQNQVSPEDAAERQKNLLRDMVDQQLLLSRSKDLGLNADAEVIRRLDEIRKQNHMDSMEDLEKAARQQGVSFEDFKANIRNGILTQQVVRDEVGRHIQMTQGQEQAYYDAHKNEFAQPEQVRLSEILVPTPADASDAVVAQAKAKAEGIAEKVKAGDSFDDLAKANSGGPTASQGGDLGLFKRGAPLAKVIEDQTFSLPAGGVTAPIRTRQGFVILKVTEHQQAGVPPLKDIEPQIQEGMYFQQMQPRLREYLTKLREEAYIDIKPGFIDSGASPHQTKPVFSAYAPPAPKKKREAKERFDRGGRFSAASKTPPAPAAKPVVATPSEASTAATSATAAPSANATSAANAPLPAQPSTTTASSKAGTPAKPKKIKREKVRFGQAPRNALPPGPQETAEGAGAGVAASTQTADAGDAVAPGTAIAPLENTNTQVANEDPLAPKPDHTGKSRYSYRAKTEAVDKAVKKQATVRQKAAYTPVAATTKEQEDRKQQAAPLGLNGDTATKKKKKREKGVAKERLQNKPTAPAPPAAPPEPTVNPSLGQGVTPAPQSTTPAPQQQPATPSAPQPNN